MQSIYKIDTVYQVNKQGTLGRTLSIDRYSNIIIKISVNCQISEKSTPCRPSYKKFLFPNYKIQD